MCKLHDEGKFRVRFVDTEFNEANVCTKNVTEAIQSHHYNNICQGKLNVWRLYKSKVLEALREDQHPKEEVFAASKTLNFSTKIEDFIEMFVGTLSNIPPKNAKDEEDQEENN